MTEEQLERLALAREKANAMRKVNQAKRLQTKMNNLSVNPDGTPKNQNNQKNNYPKKKLKKRNNYLKKNLKKNLKKKKFLKKNLKRKLLLKRKQRKKSRWL